LADCSTTVRRLAVGHDGSVGHLAGLESHHGLVLGGLQHDGKVPWVHIREAWNFGKLCAPVAINFDTRDRAAPAAVLAVEFHKALAKSRARQDLQIRTDGGAHRIAACQQAGVRGIVLILAIEVH
jgi:hypothetical protein